ncbi:outer membrane protein assembly factor BamB family protein [Mycolicibacterium sp. Dal123E01]|uniref:outer membrane protein assembly factor BamB family protein n=1 Tax=Mycolicibacterium sp. Dal123E01 TaxID=3457578 RepID=UPI00403EE614
MLGPRTALRWAAALLAGLGLLIAAVHYGVFVDAFSAVPQVAIPAAQLPLTALAVVMTVLGSAIVVVVPPPEDLRLRNRVATIGMAVALVIAAAGVGVSVALVSSLRGAVDATTAAPVPVPALPTALGKEVFRIRAGGQPIDSHEARQTVSAAGAGFVMFDRETRTIRAFDSAGDERWHYRRDGGLEVRSVKGFGNGTTLLAGLHHSQTGNRAAVIGLDALTGAVLWVSDDAELRSAYFDGEHDSPFLVQRRGDQWTAFDPRTGRQIWSVPKPLPCPKSYPLYADTTERIVLLGGCDGNGNDRRLITMDPATGAVSGSVPVPNPTTITDLTSFSMKTAGGHGVAINFSGVDAAGAAWVSRYINASTLTQTEFPRARLADSTMPAGDPLLPNSSRGTVLLNADGSPRCTFLPGVGPADAQGVLGGEPDLITWTPDTITYLTSADSHLTLRSARRSDCHETAAVDLERGDTRQVLAAPGSTILLNLGRRSAPDNGEQKNEVVGFGSYGFS